MRLAIVTYLFLLITQFINAQQDTTIALDNNFDFKDGIYLNFSQVRSNNPITRSQILTNLDKEDIDFYENLIKQDYIRFVDSGLTKTVETDKIWGFCDDGTLYINWGGDFAKLINKGHLGYFIATQRVTYYGDPTYSTYYYDPYMMYPRTTEEMRGYILDFSTGKIYDFSPQGLAQILKKYDPQLYEEYTHLRRRKQKKLIFYYLRKFNEKHPLMIKTQKSDL